MNPIEIDEGLLIPVRKALRHRFGEDTSIAGGSPLRGQASNRVNYRLRLEGARVPASVILVQLPDNPFASEEATGGEGPEELPFCAMLSFLEKQGLPVPEMVVDGSEEGFQLQEDLGPVTMLTALGGGRGGPGRGPL